MTFSVKCVFLESSSEEKWCRPLSSLCLSKGGCVLEVRDPTFPGIVEVTAVEFND